MRARCAEGGKVRKVSKVSKVRNLGEPFAHLDFGMFSAWETGKVRKCWEMCVRALRGVLDVLLDGDWVWVVVSW